MKTRKNDLGEGDLGEYQSKKYTYENKCRMFVL